MQQTAVDPAAWSARRTGIPETRKTRVVSLITPAMDRFGEYDSKSTALRAETAHRADHGSRSHACAIPSPTRARREFSVSGDRVGAAAQVPCGGDRFGVHDGLTCCGVVPGAGDEDGCSVWDAL